MWQCPHLIEQCTGFMIAAPKEAGKRVDSQVYTRSHGVGVLAASILQLADRAAETLDTTTL